MTPRRRPFATRLPLLAALLMVPLGACAARGGRISNVVPIDLQEGATLVPHLAPDGRQGLVVEARQPGARVPLIMTMLPRSVSGRGWDVVSVEDGDGRDAATLDPAGGAAVMVRAKVSGMPATLLMIARPDPDDPQPRGEARRMTISTLMLHTDTEAARFAPLASETTRQRYCTGSAALARTYRLALLDDDAGLCGAGS